MSAEETQATIPAPDGATPAGGEPEKKKRGKPKDPNAPPKPKNAFQVKSAEARQRLKDQEHPAFVKKDLKEMAAALKEEWEKVTEEEKARLTKEYEEAMKIWKPKWEAYKQTDSYKDFFEEKADWLDKRGLKKFIKSNTKDAPKRPKSGYMIFAGEIREEVMKIVQEKGLGLADCGKMISERWTALSEGEKGKYAAQSAEQKKEFDVKFLEYRKTDSFRNFMDGKAKLLASQGIKKVTRVTMREAPKKPQSAFGLYRNEVMPGVAEENQNQPPEKKLAMGDMAKKIAAMWAEVPEEKRKPYMEKAAAMKEVYDKQMLEFRTTKGYTNFLESRQKIKIRENRLLGLREMPARPKSVFQLFADDHKNEVPPGKGEGKGRHALKDLFQKTAENDKQTYVTKEAELKEKWLKDVAEYKEGEKFKTFRITEAKVKKEFMNAAVKVTTMKFLKSAPQPPPKTGFAIFLGEKRKNAPLPEKDNEGKPISKQAKKDYLTQAKTEYIALDRAMKSEYELRRKAQWSEFEKTCNEYMAQPQWQEYKAEAKRLKIPVKSLLFHKKKIVKKWGKGEKQPPSSIPMPERPGTYPSLRARSALQIFESKKKGELSTLEEINAAWTKLDAENKKPFEEESAKERELVEKEIKEFKDSPEGKTYFRAIATCRKRRTILAAKNKYLDDFPKKPMGALKAYFMEKAADIKKENPGKKSHELKKLLTDSWVALSQEDKTVWEDQAKEREKEFVQKLREFKETDNWKSFQKAVRIKKTMVKKKMKKKVVVKGPKKPESMPSKPAGAFQTFVKEKGGKLSEAAQAWKELDPEKKKEYEQAAAERAKEYTAQMNEWKSSDDAKKYHSTVKRAMIAKRLAQIKAKYMTDAPKAPPKAFTMFADANKEVKDKKEILRKWNELGDEDKQSYLGKARAAEEEYKTALTEYQNSDNYKKGRQLMATISGKTLGKAKGKAKAAMKKTEIPVPEGMPKKPRKGMMIFLAEEKEKNPAAKPKELSAAWVQLQAEGQKEYNDRGKEEEKEYEKAMSDFKKTAEGKRYFREKQGALVKAAKDKAKQRFLGGVEEPKRPQSAYFLFVADKRGTVEGKMGEIAKKLTEMWKVLEAEEKKKYEEKAVELRKEWEQKMEEFRASDGYKAYNRAITSLSGKKKTAAKAKAKAAGRGRGRGGGGGGRGAGKAVKKADSDSDSDVMGSDSDDSSSSDSDSD